MIHALRESHNVVRISDTDNGDLEVIAAKTGNPKVIIYIATTDAKSKEFKMLANAFSKKGAGYERL